MELTQTGVSEGKTAFYKHLFNSIYQQYELFRDFPPYWNFFGSRWLNNPNYELAIQRIHEARETLPHLSDWDDTPLFLVRKEILHQAFIMGVAKRIGYDDYEVAPHTAYIIGMGEETPGKDLWEDFSSLSVEEIVTRSLRLVGVTARGFDASPSNLPSITFSELARFYRDLCKQRS